LTLDQHRQVLERLVKLLKGAEGVRQHAAGFEYHPFQGDFDT
jgi:hypothetical protein